MRIRRLSFYCILLLAVAIAVALLATREPTRSSEGLAVSMGEGETREPPLLERSRSDGLAERTQWAAPAEVDLQPSASRRVLVSVTDVSGSPISDAAVSRCQEYSTHLARTDIGGAAAITFEVEDALIHCIRVTAEGFITKERAVLPSETHVQVSLSKPQTLRGRVEIRGQGPSTLPFRVVLWPTKEQEPSLAAISLLVQGDPSGLPNHVHTATTDHGGVFVVDNLDPSARYLAVAGYPGYAAHQAVRAGAETDVVLIADHIFGALMVFEADASVSIYLESALGSSTGRLGPGIPPAGFTAGWKCDDEEVLPAPVPETGALLAGVPADYLVTRKHRMLGLFRMKNGGPVSSPCKFTAHVPGFQDVEETFVPSPLDVGVEQVIVRLIAATNGWGSVILSHEGMSKEVQQLMSAAIEYDYKATVCFLEINDTASARAERFVFFLDPLGPTKFDGVPWGTYRYKVKAVRQKFTYPSAEPPPLLTVADATAEIRIDVSDLGGVLLTQTHPGDNRTYWGPSEIVAAAGAPQLSSRGTKVMRGIALQSFDHGPFILLMNAGDYTLRGRKPRWGLPADDSYLQINITGGKVVEANVTLDEG